MELGDCFVEARQLLLESLFNVATAVSPLVLGGSFNKFTSPSSSLLSLLTLPPPLLLQGSHHLSPALPHPHFLLGRRSRHRRRWKHVEDVWVASAAVDARVVGRLVQGVSQVVAASALPATLSRCHGVAEEERTNGKLDQGRGSTRMVVVVVEEVGGGVGGLH